VRQEGSTVSEPDREHDREPEPAAPSPAPPADPPPADPPLGHSTLDDPPLDSTVALLGRIKSGDATAREQLIARYLPLLQRWAHGRLPPHARGMLETGDLVQVTLLRSLDRLDQFEARREGAFLAYLRTALMNVLRNEIRRSVRGGNDALPEEVADERASFLEEMIGKEVIEAYESGLATLPATMQEAIILKVEFQFGHREIAEAIGSPSPNAARMVVSRAMVRLSKAMARHQSS
jgi:RNA polymerase sigma-70 factor (ECF subfamily)